ncbi:probable RNA-binding protein 46 [Anthonomus grandis grandis]|uniref:probable RNA-binding protein 46 n=1 Tax=Anthonomus grandis grandis TaxID=2921223 RepID=UPI002166AF14|nr:probable RNA-binding protein 46 [Anthonomus grandis grandis]
MFCQRSGSNNTSSADSICSTSKVKADKAPFLPKFDMLLEANPGYHIIQQNDQRVFEPVEATKFNNYPEGCEVFVGNIPANVFEDVLIPLFQKAGIIYKFRLVTDLDKERRGYGFVCFFDPADAQQAITLFNDYEITKDNKLAVHLSNPKRYLFIWNIPEEKTLQEVEDVFRGYFKGITAVTMYPNRQNPNHNRGYALIEFGSCFEAFEALNRLYPRNLFAWNRRLSADWADPIQECAPQYQPSIIFLSNLPREVTKEELEEVVRALVSPFVITSVYKVMSFAFVHCPEPCLADFVKDRLIGFTLFGRKINIDWADVQECSSQEGSQMKPENCCSSFRTVRGTANPRSSRSYRCNKENLFFYYNIL